MRSPTVKKTTQIVKVCIAVKSVLEAITLKSFGGVTSVKQKR